MTRQCFRQCLNDARQLTGLDDRHMLQAAESIGILTRFSQAVLHGQHMRLPTQFREMPGELGDAKAANRRIGRKMVGRDENSVCHDEVSESRGCLVRTADCR